MFLFSFILKGYTILEKNHYLGLFNGTCILFNIIIFSIIILLCVTTLLEVDNYGKLSRNLQAINSLEFSQRLSQVFIVRVILSVK